MKLINIHRLSTSLKALFLSVTLYLLPGIASAQAKDTVIITSKSVNTSVLKTGTSRYVVYFKMDKNASRTQVQFWTRSVEKFNRNGKPVIQITQEWEDKDTVMHTTTSICDAQTMQPLLHQSWWKQRGSSIYDFENKKGEINGMQLSDADTSKSRKRAWMAFKESWNSYVLNWHLDLEVFPLLPYKKGKTFLIPFYEPGSSKPELIAYTVTGTEQLTGYDDKKVDCWLLSHESNGNKELFWISKKTKEVLKLEQEINGTMYRYKIKLPFSN